MDDGIDVVLAVSVTVWGKEPVNGYHITLGGTIGLLKKDKLGEEVNRILCALKASGGVTFEQGPENTFGSKPLWDLGRVPGSKNVCKHAGLTCV